MKTNMLTAAQIASAVPPRGKTKIRLSAGPNLHLLVRRNPRGEVQRYWQLVFTRGGVTRTMGLGRADGPSGVTFKDARGRANELLRAVQNGTDPIADRLAVLAAEKAKAKLEVPFAHALEAYIERHGEDWKNPVHREQWTRSLELHAADIMRMAVNDIEHDDVFACLSRIWNKRRETASRMRGRIERVIEFAEAEGWRAPGRINPAMWRGRLRARLKNKRPKVRHHAAVAWRDVPAFMLDLQQVQGVEARCLEWTILTACRTNEALGSTWSEVDLERRIWSLSGERMKMGNAHAVPLSDQALAVLEAVKALRRPDDLIFPSALTTADDSNIGWPLSQMALLTLAKKLRPGITVHGMRSSFRDWCGDHAVARELAEMSLAHVIGDQAETAYARSILLERRRPLMQQWANFIVPPPDDAKVVPIRR